MAAAEAGRPTGAWSASGGAAPACRARPAATRVSRISGLVPGAGGTGGLAAEAACAAAGWAPGAGGSADRPCAGVAAAPAAAPRGAANGPDCEEPELAVAGAGCEPARTPAAGEAGCGRGPAAPGVEDAAGVCA